MLLTFRICHRIGMWMLYCSHAAVLLTLTCASTLAPPPSPPTSPSQKCLMSVSSLRPLFAQPLLFSWHAHVSLVQHASSPTTPPLLIPTVFSLPQILRLSSPAPSPPASPCSFLFASAVPQIVVYDVDTLEEVGELHALPFRIQRVNYRNGKNALRKGVLMGKGFVDGTGNASPAQVWTLSGGLGGEALGGASWLIIGGNHSAHILISADRSCSIVKHDEFIHVVSIVDTGCSLSLFTGR